MQTLAPLSLCFAIVLVLATVSCGGGGSSTPSSPSPTPTPSPAPTPTPAPSTGTITITSTGVSPRSLTVAAGARVTFVSNGTRVHDMNSDPHPDHTDCPEINQVGFLQPGQSRQTGNLNTVRTCGYHDHDRDSDTTLQGTITIR